MGKKKPWEAYRLPEEGLVPEHLRMKSVAELAAEAGDISDEDALRECEACEELLKHMDLDTSHGKVSY